MNQQILSQQVRASWPMADARSIEAIGVLTFPVEGGGLLSGSFKNKAIGDVVEHDFIRLGDLPQAQKFLRAEIGGLLIVLVTHPVHDLANVLKAGESAVPDAILESSAQLRELLDLARIDRTRVLFISEPEVLDDPNLLAEAIRKYKGLELATPLLITGRAAATDWSIYHALALLFFLKHPELCRLGGELEASMLASDQPGNTSDLLSSIRAVCDLEESVIEKKRLASELVSLGVDFKVIARTEVNLSKRNILLLREIAESESEHKKLISEQGALKSSLAANLSEIAALKTRNVNLANEVKKLKELERKYNLEFSSLVSKSNYLRKRGAAAEQRFSALEEEISLLRSSTSWKITAPLRFMKALLAR